MSRGDSLSRGCSASALLRPISSKFLSSLPRNFSPILSVDLFVRQSNNLAIGLYESLGYMIYRRVQAYYGGGPGEKDEDAYGAFRRLLRMMCWLRGTDLEAVLMLPWGSVFAQTCANHYPGIPRRIRYDYRRGIAAGETWCASRRTSSFEFFFSSKRSQCTSPSSAPPASRIGHRHSLQQS